MKLLTTAFALFLLWLAPVYAAPVDVSLDLTGTPRDENVSLDLAKPYNAVYARMTVDFTDADVFNEGIIVINNRALAVLFGQAADPANDNASHDITFRIPAQALNAGANTITFRHRSNDGFQVNSIDTIFTDADGEVVTEVNPPSGGGTVIEPPAGAWQSVLYPTNWTPGYKDAQGHFLQDFSYAGYHRGERNIPTIGGPVFDVTKSPYNANNSGGSDAGSAIQRAINAAKSAGGGVVYFPAGTYRIKNPSTLTIDASNIVLRGAGTGRTKLYLDLEYARKNTFISFGRNANDWADAQSGTSVRVAADIPAEAKTIRLNNIPSSLRVGDDVIVAQDITAAWVDDHNMRQYWIDQVNRVGDEKMAPRYYRTVTAINTSAREITVDIPIRYPMKTRDNTRVYKPNRSFITEVGLENLSIGMKQHSAAGPLSSTVNHRIANGTGAEKAAYEIYESAAIKMEGVKNGWVRNVTTYRPSGNSDDLHIHSRGINLIDSRNITILNTRIEKPQSRTGGGNGYLFRIDNSQENLITNSTAVAGRHNFTIQFPRTSGNVFHKYTSIDSTFPNDSHGPMMSPANLVDDSSFTGRSSQYWGISFRNRHQTSSGSGWTSTQSVIWNVVGGEKYDPFQRSAPTVNQRPFVSNQFGTGYIIGTSKTGGGNHFTCPAVSSDPLYNDNVLDSCRSTDDYVEGVGRGDTLFPQSLYLDQRMRRIGR